VLYTIYRPIAHLTKSYGRGAFPANLGDLKRARVYERDRDGCKGVCSVIHKVHLYVSEAANLPVAPVTCKTEREHTAAKRNGWCGGKFAA